MWLSTAAAAHAAPDIAQPPLSLMATRPPVGARLPVAPVQSVFHIAKSENKNQVHYGVRVDRDCHPIGENPVYAYWRMRELGPNSTEPLLDREQPAYGLHERQVVQHTLRADRIRVRLRAFADHPISIEVFRNGQRCLARALLRVHEQPAVLQSIYIDIGFLFSLNYALVRGVRVADAHAVQEKLRP